MLVKHLHQTAEVALLAEGVDRNEAYDDAYDVVIQSPSSRRAWIEIPERTDPEIHRQVALLAEGVDRNVTPLSCSSTWSRSPSSRRAWIEMLA